MNLLDYLSIEQELFLFVSLCLVIISLFLVFIIFVKLAKINSKYKDLIKSDKGENLTEIFLSNVVELDSCKEKIDQLIIQNQKIMSGFENTLQGIGVYRFNAFQDTGSDLSFAVALMDAKENGVVINSIFGREESRSYAKPIVNGKSKYDLSEEELQAINIARKRMIELRG